MANQQQSRPQQQRPPQNQMARTEPVSDDALARIDSVAGSCRLTLADQAGSMSHAVKVARGMTELKDLITPAVMREILPLMNTELGFLTDRDPSKPGRDGPPTPYRDDVVKEAFIVATLKGAKPVGNEFNIIAGRAYLTKNCYRRMVKEFPGLTNLKMSLGVPKMMGDKGATVVCRAWWGLHQQPQVMECEIPVKLNAGMGVDGALGKAEKKLLSRIWNQLTGSDLEEPDVDLETPAGEGSQIVESTADHIRDAVDAEAAHAASEESQDSPPFDGGNESTVNGRDDLAAHFEECIRRAETDFEIGSVCEELEQAIQLNEIASADAQQHLRQAAAARRQAIAQNGGWQ